MSSIVPPESSTAASVERDMYRMMTPAIEKILEDTVVGKAKSYADAAGLPEEFRDGIELRRTDSGGSAAPAWDVVNTFKGKFGEPLAKWFEEGTKRNYPIRPKLDHAGYGFGDAQPVQGRGHERRDDDEEPRNLYTERDVAPIEHGDDTQRQHPSVLSWVRGGIRYFRKEVKHPGRPPTAAMDLAQQESIEDARRKVKAALPKVEGYDLKIELELIGAG